MPASPLRRAGSVVGRTEELVALDDALDAAADGLVVALLAGGPGIGKTTLARSFADRARERSVPVHWGSCVEVGGAPAFWPWVQVLRSIGEEVLAQTSATLDARADEPFAAYEAVHEVLRQVLRDGPRVVVLDDLHSADLPTLGLLRFLATSATELPLLVIGTHRTHELRADPARDALIGTIGAVGLRLEPSNLDLDAVRSVVVEAGLGVAGDAIDALSAEVLERSGGNALYVDQLVDAIRREGPGALARIPDGIRAAVRARVDPLSESARDLVALATVLAEGTGPEVLARVAEVPLDEVAQALAAAQAAGVIGLDDGIRFTHALVRDALADELGPARRSAAHRRAAEVLAGPTRDVPSAVVAGHLLEAGEAVPPDEVATWAEAAAESARRVSGHRDAAWWAEVAAEHAARSGDVSGRGRLLAAAIGDHVAAGDGPAALALADELADLGRSAGSGFLLAQAALARTEVFEPNQDVEAPPLLREALDHPDLAGDRAVRGDLLAGLAITLGIPSVDGVPRDGGAARAAMAELADLAADGDARLRGQVAACSLGVLSGPLHHRDRLRWRQEYETLLPAGPNVLARIQHLYWSTSLALEAGELIEADRRLRDWERLAARSDSSFWRWRAAMARATLLYAQGRLDAAEQVAVGNAGLVASLNPEMAFRVVTGFLFAIRREQGRIDEIAGLDETKLGILAAAVAADRGDLDDARRLLQPVVDAAAATGPEDLYWLCLQSLVATVADLVGDAPASRAVAESLEPFVDQAVMWGRSYVFGGPVSEVVGIARRGAGEPEAAAAAFRAAIAWADRVGADGFGARARVGLVSVLPADDPGRPGIAASARTVAVRLGMGRLVAELDRLDAHAPSGRGRDDGPAADDGASEGDAGSVDGAGPTATAAEAAAGSDGPDAARSRVRTLGRFEVLPAGRDEPARWTSRKARDALKVLICRRGRAIPREELIDLLWPDADVATGRSRLSVVLTMVRNAVDPDKRLAGDPLRADRQSVALDLDLVAVDVERFLGFARDGLREGGLGRPDPGALHAAAALAEDGTFLGDDPYADFAQPLRITVERTHRDVLAALAGLAEADGDQVRAQRWWHRLLDVDPDDPAARRATGA